MFCQNCGTQHEDTAKFCPNCGHSVLKTSQDISPPTPNLPQDSPTYDVSNINLNDYSDGGKYGDFTDGERYVNVEPVVYSLNEPAPAPQVSIEIKQGKYKRFTVLMFCLFLGGLGIHRFYVGKIGTGVLWIVITMCTSGIGGIIAALVDFIMILTGDFKDKGGRPLIK